MMPIRKLLSRKFNIDCLNMAGLLAFVLLLALPIQQIEQWACRKATPSFFTRCQNQFGIHLQLREQLRYCTGFPFNPTKTPCEPKFGVKTNQSV